VGTESFHADGQADMTKLPLALRNFAKAPKFFVISTGGINVFILFTQKNSDYFPGSINVLVFVMEEFTPYRIESASKIDFQQLKYNNIG
jgi:hypothetical protein